MNFIHVFFNYINLGLTHVIPFGFDHILFILSLILLSNSIKTLLIQCSVFTIAHSFTMTLATLGYIIPNPNIIEPLIAISILYASIENIVIENPNRMRYIVVFSFGLIHGLGFANALNEIGLPKTDFSFALISFNIGVELGQITVIVLAYILLVYWFKEKSWYRNKIVLPASSIIGCIAIIMTIQRIMTF